MPRSIGELGTLDDGLISSPAVFTPLSSIRRYRDDRSSLPLLPFFWLLLGSTSASLIRLELRTPVSVNMLIGGFVLPSFVIFCSPVRYRFCRGGRDPSTVVVAISGDDGRELWKEPCGDASGSSSACSRGDQGGMLADSTTSFALSPSQSASRSTIDLRRRLLNTRDSGLRMLDNRGDGRTYPLSVAGVSGEFEYGDERGEFGSDGIEWSPLVAGDEGVDRGGPPFRPFGRGGGSRPPPAGTVRVGGGSTGAAFTVDCAQ
ncbi:hypothetical protein L226DRAFT_16855 [Lentinus tigrinus ALCF2SS1-7]|uniref:uncharacterized protein n=1 Tax=Lentinus tigrinus ALCF2SS1-7 TaxID=1328758 RepID=UPI0011663655|nr:hypothetical protein L226DRAFT_16855 [Lentinus tigrinus ALCF2SS1-7]